MLRITLDTNVVDPAGLSMIEAACAGYDVDVKFTTVTQREQEGTPFAPGPGGIVETGIWDESRWGHFVWGDNAIPETLVLDESRVGKAVIGRDDAPTVLEAILAVISDGQFPPLGKRDTLTKGQRRQLRDAMILEAHVREERDVFVTNDERDFIRGGKRERLKSLCSTQIFNVDEFCEWIAEQHNEVDSTCDPEHRSS
jgi:hypothetical protein